MKKKESSNYLEKIPLRADLVWSADDDGNITLEIENRGVFNRLAQKLLKKPPVTFVHLDKMGSFIWPLIDGKRDVLAIAADVDAHFGEEAHPLYERLVKYLQILESYNFIKWNE